MRINKISQNVKFGYKMTDEFVAQMIKRRGIDEAADKIKIFKELGNDSFTLDCIHNNYYYHLDENINGKPVADFHEELDIQPYQIEAMALKKVLKEHDKNNTMCTGAAHALLKYPHHKAMIIDFYKTHPIRPVEPRCTHTYVY